MQAPTSSSAPDPRTRLETRAIELREARSALAQEMTRLGYGTFSGSDTTRVTPTGTFNDSDVNIITPSSSYEIYSPYHPGDLDTTHLVELALACLDLQEKLERLEHALAVLIED